MSRKKRSIILIVIMTLVVAVYAFAGEILTNATVISMVKAKFGEKLIISKIKSSENKFDVSMDGIMQLKKDGVTEDIISAMIDASKPNSVGDPKTSLIPTSYGYYVVDENQLVELKLTPVITKMGLEVGGRSGLGYAKDGFAGDPPLSLRGRSPIFIVYQQNIVAFWRKKTVDVGSFRLSDLVYVDTKPAYVFNIIGTKPMFFRNVYGRDENDEIQINLWSPKTDVPLRVEPVEGKSGMYRLIPQSPLGPGRYAFYIEGDINPHNSVITTTNDRKSSAFYFEVSENTSVQQNSIQIEGNDPCAKFSFDPSKYTNLSPAMKRVVEERKNKVKQECLEKHKK